MALSLPIPKLALPFASAITTSMSLDAHLGALGKMVGIAAVTWRGRR